MCIRDSCGTGHARPATPPFPMRTIVTGTPPTIVRMGNGCGGGLTTLGAWNLSSRVPRLPPSPQMRGPRMPERTLILLRHAKSNWAGDEADVDRPLAERGLHQAPLAGQWLAGNI